MVRIFISPDIFSRMGVIAHPGTPWAWRPPLGPSLCPPPVAASPADASHTGALWGPKHPTKKSERMFPWPTASDVHGMFPTSKPGPVGEKGRGNSFLNCSWQKRQIILHIDLRFLCFEVIGFVTADVLAIRPFWASLLGFSFRNVQNT